MTGLHAPAKQAIRLWRWQDAPPLVRDFCEYRGGYNDVLWVMLLPEGMKPADVPLSPINFCSVGIQELHTKQYLITGYNPGEDEETE